jgi:serine O-acetyltransferase
MTFTGTRRRSGRVMARRHRRPFATDLGRYYPQALGGRPRLRHKLLVWLFDRELHCVASLRFGQAARALFDRSRLLGLLPLVLAELWRRWVTTVHHLNIARDATFGPGLYVVHRSGIYVGPVTVGENCVLHQNVTLGAKWAGGERGVPTLGDNVWIGPGATVSGDITIGSNVTISAGTVLAKSVPDGCLVAGNPGRVVRSDYDNRSMMEAG